MSKFTQRCEVYRFFYQHFRVVLMRLTTKFIVCNGSHFMSSVEECFDEVLSVDPVAFSTNWHCIQNFVAVDIWQHQMYAQNSTKYFLKCAREKSYKPVETRKFVGKKTRKNRVKSLVDVTNRESTNCYCHVSKDSIEDRYTTFLFFFLIKSTVPIRTREMN